MVGRRLALALLLVLLNGPAGAQCRLALALALDVSGSVDQREYALQMGGVAEALGDDAVADALLALPEVPVALAVYEWSSSSFQRVVLDWTSIATRADLDAVRATLLQTGRSPSPEATGLGAALEFGRALIERAPDCWDRTLDVSADGKNNDWPTPERLRAQGRLGTMRINALVIGTDFEGTRDRTEAGAAELAAYYRAKIINGPDSFVEVALGFEDYATALKRKLLRELATRPLGAIPAPRPDNRRAALTSR